MQVLRATIGRAVVLFLPTHGWGLPTPSDSGTYDVLTIELAPSTHVVVKEKRTLS